MHKKSPTIRAFIETISHIEIFDLIVGLIELIFFFFLLLYNFIVTVLLWSLGETNKFICMHLGSSYYTMSINMNYSCSHCATITTTMKRQQHQLFQTQMVNATRWLNATENVIHKHISKCKNVCVFVSLYLCTRIVHIIENKELWNVLCMENVQRKTNQKKMYYKIS